MQYLIFLLLSGATTLLAMLVVLKVFPLIGLMDKPWDYGQERAPVPYPAGVVIYIVFASLACLLFPMTMQLGGMVLAGGILVLYSAIDDRLRLPAWSKIAVHLIIATIVALTSSGIEVISNPFGGIFDLRLWEFQVHFGNILHTVYPLAALFTVAWIFFVMNAVNLLDGIPGLVSGVGSIASATLWGLGILLIMSATTTPEEKLAAMHFSQLAIILCGVLLVFNRFDMHPPKVIIGDSGAMFIGFMLALLSIYSGGKIATTLIVLGLPLVDMVWVALRRISKGQSPLQADTNHYHHKLLRLGLTERQVLYTMYLISIVLGVLSLGLLFYFQSIGKYITFGLILLLVFLTSIVLIKHEQEQRRGF